MFKDCKGFLRFANTLRYFWDLHLFEIFYDFEDFHAIFKFLGFSKAVEILEDFLSLQEFSNIGRLLGI